MDEAFDPYRKWLGIPLAEQPPNHYRLLGLAAFESDPDVIANAADARMAHVKTFQTGRHADLSQQVLNHLASAKLCLLRPESKAEYDRQLQAELDAQPPVGQSPPLTAVPIPPPLEAAPPSHPHGPPAIRPTAGGGRTRRNSAYFKRRRRQTWLVVVALVLLIGILGAALVIVVTRPPQGTPWRIAPATSPRRATSPTVASPAPADHPAASVAPEETSERSEPDASSGEPAGP